jgi:hypothetical protein
MKSSFVLKCRSIALMMVFLASANFASADSVGPLHFPAPAGWQKTSLRPGLISWSSNADGVNREGACSIFMTWAGFGANPRAFGEGWGHALSLLNLPATLKTPGYVEKAMPGGLTMSRGGYAFTPQAGQADYVALANIATQDFGQAFLALGTRAACEPAFSVFLSKMTVDDFATGVAARGTGGATGNTASPASALASMYAQGRADDLRRQAQQAQDQQQQDRLAQQRDMQRQADNRLAQQREQDRINQQRIQDSYRR